MSLNAQNDIASRIEDAVFELMATTPVQSIRLIFNLNATA